MHYQKFVLGESNFLKTIDNATSPNPLGVFCRYCPRWHLSLGDVSDTGLKHCSSLTDQDYGDKQYSTHYLGICLVSRESYQRWKHFFPTFFVGPKRSVFFFFLEL